MKSIPWTAATFQLLEGKPQLVALAERLRRVFAVDILSCPHCGGPRRLIARLTGPIVVRKFLAHLAHPTEPPQPAPARSPDLLDFAWATVPCTAEHVPRPRVARRPAGPLVSPAPAPMPQHASNGSPDRHAGPIWALVDHLTDRSGAARRAYVVHDGRLRRKSSAWSSHPPTMMNGDLSPGFGLS